MSRILRDLKTMNSHTLETTGIQYFPEEDNVRSGIALVVGPKDTPYEDGIYIIKCTFPEDYPFGPIVCKHISHCSLRQSPNFHENGKVCLSRLNTWTSEPTLQWTPALSLEYVLKMIQMQVLTNNPLDNEPGYNYSKTDKVNTANYNQLVEFINCKYNVCMLYASLPHGLNSTIHTVIRSFIDNRKDGYLAKFRAKSVDDGKYVNCTKYHNCNTYIAYDKLCFEK
jgi:ubiquitin-protein ligase